MLPRTTWWELPGVCHSILYNCIGKINNLKGGVILMLRFNKINHKNIIMSVASYDCSVFNDAENDMHFQEMYSLFGDICILYK